MFQFTFHLFGTQSIPVALETLTGPSSGDRGSYDHSYLGQAEETRAHPARPLLALRAASGLDNQGLRVTGGWGARDAVCR